VTTLEESLERALQEYNVADATIAEWREQFLALRVTDLASKEQVDAVHKARMIVKSARVEVEKTRKRLKENALKWGRAVDAEARRITTLLEPIEKHLGAEEDKPAAERRRIEELERREREAKLRARLEALRDAGAAALEQDVRDLSDEEFAAVLGEARAQKAEREAAEAERRAAEEKRLAAERERLERERAEQERIRARQEAEAAVRRKEEQEAAERERAQLAAERRAMEEERARVEAEARRQAEEEAARQRAAEEKARQEAEAAAKAEAARIAAERAPDREKVEAFASALAAVPVPEVWCRAEIAAARDQLVGQIRYWSEAAS